MSARMSRLAEKLSASSPPPNGMLIGYNPSDDPMHKSFYVIILLFFVISPCARADEAEAPDLSDGVCFECHSDPEFSIQDAKGKTISLFVDQEKYKKSFHSENGCISCHADITEIPHAEGLKKVECATCHSEQSEVYLESTHGKAFAAGIPEAPTCVTCHGKHDIRHPSDPEAKTHTLHQIEICTDCHLNPKIAGKYNLPKADKIEAYKQSIHGRGVLKSGLLGSANCVSCHTAHNVRPKTDPKSTIYRENIPKLCGTCHLGIFDEFQDSEHGILWAKKSPDGPGCVTCHGSHGILDPVTTEFQLDVPNLCMKCHKVQGPTYRDNFHGQVTQLGFLASATCKDCHTAHQNLPAKDPRSTVHPANLKTTCGACHGAVSSAYITYDPHMNPSDPKGNKVVHYIWLFFMSTICLTFGFFGIHYLLWFQRSMAAHRRGEVKKHGEKGPFIRRFAPAHVWVHIAIVVSFTVLSITGFTIYFHNFKWAQATANLLGGIGFMRYLHRVSAMITFGYAFVHVGYLWYCRFILKRKNDLFGPNSMLPQVKDLKDFFANARWFLYMGPAPKLDRWAYWEKLEYLVEFWGIPVIGISGLALWYPKIFTAFLPGWTLNAAQVIHTYEAFLAAGYIFLFHFFVAHLRPETFPIDTSIFTGKITLDRFEEERPLEYERLSRSGELEDRLVDPPTENQMKNARIFGYIAAAAGALLMVAILWSLSTMLLKL